MYLYQYVYQIKSLEKTDALYFLDQNTTNAGKGLFPASSKIDTH